MDLPKWMPGTRVGLLCTQPDFVWDVVQMAWNRRWTLRLFPPATPVETIGPEHGLDVMIDAYDFQELGESTARHRNLDVAMEIQTSGSSGLPKWIPIRREMVQHHVHAACERLGHSEDSVWLHLLPTHHVGGQMILHRVHQRGGQVRFVDPRDVEAQRRALPGVTHVSLVPRQLQRWLDAGFEVPASLRCVLVGGDRLDPHLALGALDAGWPVFASYGMTETSSQCVTATPEQLRAHPDCVGSPLRGVQIQIHHDQGGRIRVLGPTVLDGDFLTEDYGEIVDGVLRITGREATRIVVNGETLDARRIEETLRDLPGILDVVVFGIPDATRGEAIIACYEGTAAPETVEHALGGIHRIWRATPMDLPRSELGKPLRGQIKAQYLASNP